MAAEAGNVVSFRARQASAACPPPPASQDPTEEAMDRFRNAFDAIMAADFDHEKKIELALLMRQLVVITARIHLVMRSCVIEKSV